MSLFKTANEAIEIPTVAEREPIVFAMDWWVGDAGDAGVFGINNWPEDWRPVASAPPMIPPFIGREVLDLKPGDHLKTDAELITTRKVKMSDNYLNNQFSWIEFHLTDQIPPGNKYFYPIEINQPGSITDFGHLMEGFKWVKPRVIDDVKNGRAKILIMMPYEGDYQRNLLIELDRWMQLANLQQGSVYFINANIQAERIINELGLNIISECLPLIFLTMFPKFKTTENDEWISNVRQSPTEYKPITDKTKNLFLCYNRRPRWHRSILLAVLLKNKIWEKGLISWRPDMFEIPKGGFKNNLGISMPDLEDYGFVLDCIGSLEIDMDLAANNPAVDVQTAHYEQTFLSLIPETSYYDDSTFFSEKIWKTIRVGHPFMIVSSPGMLETLKSFGFKTFDLWWDESYDNELDLRTRIDMIAQELVKLSKKSVTELKHLREGMRTVIAYNQKLANNIAKLTAVQMIAQSADKLWGTF